MRKHVVLLPALLAVLALTGCVYAKVGVEMDPKVVVSKDDGKVFQHVVLLKFQPGITEADLDQIAQGLKKMKDAVPEVRDMQWGKNVPANERNQGYTHCLIVTFDSEADHDAYQVHPAHDAFREFLAPYSPEIVVVDFYVADTP